MSSLHEPEADGSREPLEGRVVGDYVLCEKLGEGGFGVVYRARQRQLDREAVIKVLARRHGGAEARERFLREARLLSRFDHPFAAHVYASGAEDDGLLWIAMEIVRGTPLDAYVRARGPLSPAALAPLFSRICEVVQAAHDQGITHRDLKPANVMVVERAGQLSPKLLDFGLARAEGEAMRDAEPEIIAPIASLSAPRAEAARDDRTASFFAVTEGRRVVGSPHYMAPEQWIDASAAGARADLYALGALAFAALSGRPPFSGERLADLARAHAEAPIPSLGLSPALDAFMARAMARRPEDRFASAIEMGEAFARAARARAPRRSILARIAIAAIAIGLAIAAVLAFLPRTLPWGARRLAVVTAAGAPEDAWLVRATARLATKRLADGPRRFAVEGDRRAANVLLEVSAAPDGDAVIVRARLGRAGGRLSPFADVRARSVAEALDALLPRVAARVGEGAPDRDVERTIEREMKRRGASSREAFALQRAAFEGFYAAVYTDGARFVRMAEAAVAKDEGWARAYASLAMMQGQYSDAAKATLARASARMDRTRDAAGAAAVDALSLLAAGRPRDAAALLSPIFQADPSDLVAGYTLAVAHLQAPDPSAATSVLARLHDQRPDLQFGDDLAENRRKAGQRREAAKLLEAWTERAPESEQAWLSRALSALDDAHPREAVRLARRASTIHGEATFRLAPIIDVLIAADEPAEARRLGERMLTGDEFDRARGYRRLASADLLEGRFGSAYHNLEASLALARTQGSEGEAVALLHTMAALAPLLAPKEEQARVHQALARLPGEVNAVVSAFELSLLTSPAGACPSIAAAIAALPEGAQRTSARRELLRAASAYGCAACADVIRAGLAPQEPFADSLFRFASCAEHEGALPLARAAFERAAELHGTISIFHAVLSRFHLGRVLARLGEREASRAALTDFLAHWARADHPLPAIDEARALLR